MLQGSILGPLIFLLYINDLPQSSSVAIFVLYAHNTTVMFKGSDIDALYHDTNIKLIKIFDWHLDNKLAINFKKTNYLLFHHVSSGLFNPVLCSIMIGNDVILKSSTASLLRYILDENFYWKKHVNRLMTRFVHNNALLTCASKCFPESCLVLLYHAFFVLI